MSTEAITSQCYGTNLRLGRCELGVGLAWMVEAQM